MTDTARSRLSPQALRRRLPSGDMAGTTAYVRSGDPLPPLPDDLRAPAEASDSGFALFTTDAEQLLVVPPFPISASATFDRIEAAPLLESVERLAKLKGRPGDAPFALAIKSADEALDYVPDMVPLARRLARRCWPGPVTLVVENRHKDGLTEQLPQRGRKYICPNGTIGLRVAANSTLLDVLRMLAGPIVLTSANKSGDLRVKQLRH